MRVNIMDYPFNFRFDFILVCFVYVCEDCIYMFIWISEWVCLCLSSPYWLSSDEKVVNVMIPPQIRFHCNSLTTETSFMNPAVPEFFIIIKEQNITKKGYNYSWKTSKKRLQIHLRNEETNLIFSRKKIYIERMLE